MNVSHLHVAVYSIDFFIGGGGECEYQLHHNQGHPKMSCINKYEKMKQNVAEPNFLQYQINIIILLNNAPSELSKKSHDRANKTCLSGNEFHIPPLGNLDVFHS